MSIYGTYINDRHIKENFNDLLTYTKCLESIIESEDEEEMLSEGANTDITTKFNKYRRTFKAECKKLKKALKNNEYDKSLEIIKNLQDITDETEKEIRDIDADSLTSVTIGLLLSLLCTFCQTFSFSLYHPDINHMASAPVKVFNFAFSVFTLVKLGPLKSIAYIVDDMTKAIDEVKKAKKEKFKDKNFLNAYRTKILASMDQFKKQIKITETSIKKAKAKAEKNKKK